MSDTTYCYPPDFTVLKNKFDLRDQAELDRVERRMVRTRILERCPTGVFDLAHLQAIHRHLFQDIYEWAGQIRTVEISKGGSQFQFRQFIETGMADIHRRLQTHDFLRHLTAEDFVSLAGEIIGDVNHVHPFREGNGRAQLEYVEQLAQQAGHAVDLTRLEQGAWMSASREAHLGDYDPLRACIEKTLIAPKRNQSRSRTRRR